MRRRDVGLAGVAAALRLGVAGEVLRGGQDRGRVVEAVALVAADHRRAELADEERVLAERLVDPAPAQVAGDAQHRREGPVDAGRGTSTAVTRATRSTSVGVPGCTPCPSWVGKIVAPCQNEWPWMQSSATSSGICSRVCAVSSSASQHPLGRRVQDRAGVLAQHQVVEVLAGVELQHLPDLLRERHARRAGRRPLGDGTASGPGRAAVGERGHELSWSLGVVRTTRDGRRSRSCPSCFSARARSPAERRRGLTYSSMPKLTSASDDPEQRRCTARPACTTTSSSRERALFCCAQKRIVPQFQVGDRDDADERERRQRRGSRPSRCRRSSRR